MSNAPRHRGDDLLTVAEAADYLTVTERFVRRLVFEKRVPYVKLGRHVRLAVSDLDAFCASGRVEVAPLHPLLLARSDRGLTGTGSRRRRRRTAS